MPCRDRKVIDKVAEAISILRRKIVLDSPFYTMACMRLRLVVMDDEECKRDAEVSGMYMRTAATDGRRLFINPKGFMALTRKQQMFVLLHEILHCLLLHCVRRGTRDRKLWNIAVDLVVNYALYKTMMRSNSGGGKFSGVSYDILDDCLFTEELYGHQVEGMSAEMIYDILAVKRPDLKGPKSIYVMMRYDWKKRPKDDSPREPGGSFPVVEPGDFDVVDEDGNPVDLSKEDAQKLADSWRDIAAAAMHAGRMHGDLPAGIEQLIMMATKPIVSWRRRLSKLMTATVKSGVNWSCPSKRMLYLDTYMPSRRQPSMGQVLVAIDTSGSVSKEDVAQFLAEANAIASCHRCKIVLVTADVDLAVIGKYDSTHRMPIEVPIVGGGGTSFVKVFEWVEKENRSPVPIRLVVYLTDGAGEYPSWKVRVPTIWVINHGSHAPGSPYYPPFGEVVAMEDE